MRTALALGALLMAVSTIVPARAESAWDRYQVILWQDRTKAQLGGLRALGFTATRVGATGGHVDTAGRALRLELGLGYYLENVATDFYAAYHRWTEGKEVNWLYDAARARYRANPGDPTLYHREPSLSDPAWLDRIRARLDQLVRAEAPYRPLFYNLGDESGIADLAANWDFDQSPASLAGFRTWLQTQYPSLDALNRQWGTAYAAWDDIRPEGTDAAIRRTDQNFSAWSDFKAWMDVAFARAVQAGTAAIHAADPTARSGLEGGQIPGWGGYDYGLLAPAVDVFEIYDNGNALDLAMAANPALIPLRTSAGTGPGEAHAAWRSLLHGGRGMVVWDENDDVVGAEGNAGPRGLEIAALTRAITPVAALLHQAEPAPDKVAVLVNQASFRIRWILDRQAGDHDWVARDAEREYDDNAWRASRRILLQRLAELGVQPRLLTSGMLESGALRQDGTQILLLPHAIALSDAERDAILAFQSAGGTVLADTEPGLFDGHGRRRTTPALPGVKHPAALRPDGSDINPEAQAALGALLTEAGAPPRLRLFTPGRQPATGIEARWFRHPTGTILALQTSRPGSVSGPVILRLPARMAVTDLRHPGAPVTTDRMEIPLDPVEPTVLLLAAP